MSTPQTSPIKTIYSRCLTTGSENCTRKRGARAHLNFYPRPKLKMHYFKTRHSKTTPTKKHQQGRKSRPPKIIRRLKCWWIFLRAVSRSNADLRANRPKTTKMRLVCQTSTTRWSPWVPSRETTISSNKLTKMYRQLPHRILFRISHSRRFEEWTTCWSSQTARILQLLRLWRRQAIHYL